MTPTATVLRSDIVIIGDGAGGLEPAARPGRKRGREAVRLHHRARLGTGGTAVLALARLLQRRISGRVTLH